MIAHKRCLVRPPGYGAMKSVQLMNTLEAKTHARAFHRAECLMRFAHAITFTTKLDSLPALRAAKLEPSLEVFPENVDGRRRHILSHYAPARVQVK